MVSVRGFLEKLGLIRERKELEPCEYTVDFFMEQVKQGVMLTDFSTEWCPPCVPMKEFLEENDFNVVIVDADRCSELADRYEIKYLPTVQVWFNGKIYSRSEGYTKKEAHKIEKLYSLFERVQNFAEEHNCKINEDMLKVAVKYEGERCPCRRNIKTCPCTDAEDFLLKSGSCYCKLFYYDEFEAEGGE